ncbi:hypothetical protein B7H23_05390 [Notoacmeibacter marinus]|uniref:Uncharacterized protein n=1 Tax=Notoacmeibacter marinus TaxID=1876515 RepID=A0A231V2C0_9HYPH|nr:hypothetical protein B7H23_05390 [Notoacmeibacter marinus]
MCPDNKRKGDGNVGIFRFLQPIGRSNPPYSPNGEWPSIFIVSSLNRVTDPLFERFLASLCPFCRQNSSIYEFMT